MFLYVGNVRYFANILYQFVRFSNNFCYVGPHFYCLKVKQERIKKDIGGF